MDAQFGPMQQERQNLSNTEKWGILATASTHRDPEGKSERQQHTDEKAYPRTVHLVGTCANYCIITSLHQEYTMQTENHRGKFFIMIFLFVYLAIDKCYLIYVISGVVYLILVICERIVREPIAIIIVKALWLLPESKDFTAEDSKSGYYQLLTKKLTGLCYLYNYLNFCMQLRNFGGLEVNDLVSIQQIFI